MGLLFGLMLSGMVAYGVYWFVRSSETRRDFWAEFKQAPFYSAYICVWVVFALVFLWGILIPVMGTTKLYLSGYEIQLWQLGEIGALVMFIGLFFVREPSR